MMPNTLRSRGPILLALTLAILAIARAASAAGEPQFIKDWTGETFSAGAIQRAEQAIAPLKQALGKELVVEVFPRIPGDRLARFDPARRDELYRAWAAENMKTVGGDGVYVLVTRDPNHLQVMIGDATTREKAFTTADRDRLRDTLVSHFRRGEFDQGLLAGVDQVRAAFEKNTGRRIGAAGAASAVGASAPGNQRSQQPAAPVPQRRSTGGFPLNVSACFMVGLIFLAVIVVISMLGKRRAQHPYGYGPRGGYPPQQGGYGPHGGYGPGYPPPQRGGFGRGVMGGLLGGLGGYLLGSHLFGRGNQADAAQPPQGADPDNLGTGGPPPLESDHGNAYLGDPGGGGSFDPPDPSNFDVESGGGGFDAGADFGSDDFGGGGDF